MNSDKVFSLSIRWGAVGLLNTAMGLSLIWILRVIGLGDYLSNLIAYSFLIPLSFWLHSRFSLRRPVSSTNFAFYLLAVALGYVLNIVTVYFFIRFGNFGMVAHVFGMLAYTVCTFIVYTLSPQKQVLQRRLLPPPGVRTDNLS
jgi:putative flippase GtrA